MKIRNYHKKDKKQVKSLIEKVLFEIFNVKPNSFWELRDLDNIKKNYILFLVAEDKDKIIGTIALMKGENKNQVILKRMYLDKKHRGTGLSQKLYKIIENYCNQKRINKILLSTTPQMKSAIKFYKNLGFIRTKTNKKTNQIFFEKEL